MKKKNLVAKGMAMLMACAMVVGNTGIVAHAEYWDDGLYHGDGREPGGSSPSDGSDDITPDRYSHGSLYTEYDNLAPGESFSSGGGSSDSGSSHSGGGSSDSGSSDSGNYSYDGGSSSSGDSGASYSAPAPKAAGGTTSAGKEQFRALAKSGDGTYKVTHKGVEIATFTLMDADKKAVPCTAVFLKQREDGKWAIEFQVTEKYAETTQAADTTGLTVGAPLDRTYMYNTLGVSYVTINDTVVIDIEAEAQAAATK